MKKVAKRAPAKAKTATGAKAAAPAKPRKTAAKTAKLSPEQAKAKKALEAQVKTISRDIDKAEREAKRALKAAEKRYRSLLAQLKTDRGKLQQRFKVLAGQGESAFDEIKIGVEGAYKELAEAVVKAYGHFK